MISATLAPTSSSPPKSGALAPDATLETGGAASASDFLMELQAAMSVPEELSLEAAPNQALPDAAQNPAAQPSSELQKVPDASVAADLAAAIFAVAPTVLNRSAQDVADTQADAAVSDVIGMAASAGTSLSESMVLPLSMGRADATHSTPLHLSATEQASPKAVINALIGTPDSAVALGSKLIEGTESARLSTTTTTNGTLTATLIPGMVKPESTSDLRSALSELSTSSAPVAAVSGSMTNATELASDADANATSISQPMKGERKIDTDHSVNPSDSPADSAESARSIATSTGADVTGDSPDLRPSALPSTSATSNTDVAQTTPSQILGVSTAQTSSGSATSSVPLMDTTQRMPLEPHMMRLDSGPVQTEVIKLVRQGGGQIVLELTHPDQGTYRLDLRMDTQGKALLVVEGASDSVRTRLEQGESGLRDQLSQLGLSLELNYKQQGNSLASQDAQRHELQGDDNQAQAFDGLGERDQPATRANLDRGLVHLYA